MSGSMSKEEWEASNFNNVEVDRQQKVIDDLRQQLAVSQQRIVVLEGSVRDYYTWLSAAQQANDSLTKLVREYQQAHSVQYHSPAETTTLQRIQRTRRLERAERALQEVQLPVTNNS